MSLIVDEYLSTKLHGLTYAVKVLNCAKIMSKLMCTPLAIFLNEMWVSHESGR